MSAEELLERPGRARHRGWAVAGGGRANAMAGRLGVALLRLLGRHLEVGSVTVTAGGRTWKAGEGEPHASVVVHDHRAIAALVAHGSVGLGEGYIEGWWHADDLTALVRVLVANRGRLGAVRDDLGRLVHPLVDPLRRLGAPAKADDRRRVRAHYDLGDELFSLMLDPTMSYSCAVFERPGMSLEEASVAKLDRICRRLGLSPGVHLLEIGAGWGGLACHAAARYGCRVTTTTISAAQEAAVRERVAREGLGGLVEVRGDDYRDLAGHERFDRLVSVEMVEAVDWRRLDTYFATCVRLLRPDGLMALQAITIDDRSYHRAKSGTDFVKAYVFPGSCLPSVEVLVRAAARVGLRVTWLEDIGLHYAETLRRWRANLDQRAHELAALGLGERFERLWRLYLSYCEAAFLERHVSDVQMVLAMPGWRDPPVGCAG